MSSGNYLIILGFILSMWLDANVLKFFLTCRLHKQEEIYHCSPLRFTTILETIMVVKTENELSHRQDLQYKCMASGCPGLL